ncbi:hypothetical protein D3C72_915800 [compost metagenome]
MSDVGAGQQFVGGRGVFPPFVAVAPILGRDLEILEGRFFSLAEPFQLHVGGDCKPEFQHQRAARDELLFEVVDLGVRPAPFGGRDQLFDAFDQHPAIPGAVEDRDASVARDAAPEAP